MKPFKKYLNEWSSPEQQEKANAIHSHFKNKKHSEETKKLLGAKSTNYFSVEENRLIFGNKMKGKTHSEETKQKIGNKRRNTKQSEETKTKISNSLKGKPKTFNPIQQEKILKKYKNKKSYFRQKDG